MFIGIGNDYRRQAYSEELTAWLAAGTTAGHTLPSSTVLSALDTFLATPLASGTIISRMKTGYIFHAGSKGMAKLNLKDPALYPLTESGTVTFSDGNGCKSAANSYFNQGYPANAYAGIETNSTFISYVSESSTVTSTASVSGFRVSSATGAFVIMRPLNTASTLQVLHYSAGAYAPASSSTNHKGLLILSRNAGSVVVYKDGNKYTSAVATTAPDAAISRFILAYNSATTAGAGTASGHYPNYVATDFIFDAFTDSDESAFRTAFNTYKTAVGLP